MESYPWQSAFVIEHPDEADRFVVAINCGMGHGICLYYANDPLSGICEFQDKPAARSAQNRIHSLSESEWKSSNPGWYEEIF